MKKYIIRSVKYFIAFCVVYVAFMLFAHYSEQLPITFAERWQLMFATWRGWGMVVGIVVLATTYPFFGFAKRSIEGDIVADREQLDTAAEVAGLKFKGEENGVLVYSAYGFRRVMRLFEDEVRVSQNSKHKIRLALMFPPNRRSENSSAQKRTERRCAFQKSSPSTVCHSFNPFTLSDSEWRIRDSTSCFCTANAVP
jgi:hypothetical protein